MAEAAKTGVDDFLAAGGTVAELLLLARPFEPADVGAERLKRNEGLRDAIGKLWASWREMPARKIGECSERAAERVLIAAAERGGKLDAEGVLVVLSARDGADAANISLGGWKNAIDRLETSGRVRRQMWGRAKDKPGAYLLIIPSHGGRALGEHNGKGGQVEGRVSQEEESISPLSNSTYDRRVHLTRAPSDEVPELRWPKVVHTWEWRSRRRRVVVDSHYVARLGKRRGEIIRYTLEVGGEATVEELHEQFGARRGRPRDFRRRMLGPLEREEIITLDGENVSLAPAWRKALEEVRERDEEIADSQRQADKHAREKKAFRKARRDGWDPTPELMGRERTATVLRKRERDAQRANIEEQRRKVGTTAAVFVGDELEGISGVRWRDLRDRWIHRGGKGEDLRRAVTFGPFRFGRESADGEALYVYSATARPLKQSHASDQAAAAVVRLRPGVNVQTPKKEGPAERISETRAAENIYSPPKKEPPGDWRDHAIDCECEECLAPIPMRYVKIGGAS